jgi:hypothetical protein
MFDAAAIEYLRKMNDTMWTPELDRELMHALRKYVVATGYILGIFLLCQKYNCTLGAIEERVEIILSQSLERLQSRWEVFGSKLAEEWVVLS